MALKYLSEAGIKEIFRLVKQKYLAKADASDVATSGSYTDLLNKPTKVSEWQNDAGYLVPADIAGKANAADLKAVAFSGAYGDLTGKPTIPTVPVISTNVAQDADDNTKTVSPAAVAAYVEAAAGVAIDGEMDEDSQNPVQNMAICAALTEKADADDVTALQTSMEEALSGKASTQALLDVEEVVSGKADKSELPQTTGGAFTPSISGDMTATVQAMQIGDVGYVTGSVEFIGATIADLPNRKLGELGNVSAPYMKTYIPCQSFDGSSWHTGYLVIETTNEVYANCVSTDTLIIFNGYYLA